MIEGVTVVVTGLQDAVTATSVHVWEEEVKELQFIPLSLSLSTVEPLYSGHHSGLIFWPL